MDDPALDETVVAPKSCKEKCSCDPSQTFMQGSLVLLVLGASFAVLFLVSKGSDQLACDYTDVIETCDDQPFYRTDGERTNALNHFNHMWLMTAQEMRNDTEKQKCQVEEKLMEDLTQTHLQEARKIIKKCHATFQQCVDDLRREMSFTTTTSTTTITIKVAVRVTTTLKQSDCEKMAQGSGGNAATGSYLDCITGGKPKPTLAPQPGAASGPAAPLGQIDCTRCDSFCRSFNWSQWDPEYAKTMEYSSFRGCGPKVCPWNAECGSGMNLHRNCSERGCPCERATCITTTTTSTTLGGLAGGRRLQDSSAAPTTTVPDVPYTTTTTYESLENNTQCTCKPGIVDTVLVGRPWKVFFADPSTMIRRRRASSNSTGRRLEAETAWRRLEVDFEARMLNDLYSDPHNVPVEYLQGVHIEMEEELIVTRERSYDCRETFSDRYKYVYPRSKGEPGSLEALLARQSHPDLGCGYKGNFRVTCQPEIVDSEHTGNCSYKVDISTCEPPSYKEAIDNCYVEETWSGNQAQVFAPTVTDFLDVEELNLTTSEAVASNTIEATDNSQCCEPHVGSECVASREHPGTVNGTWMPEKSHTREFGYFPVIPCSKQAPLTRHLCPRVKIKKLDAATTYQHDLLWQCDLSCNLTSAQDELQQLCDSNVNSATHDREQRALRDKIAWMRAQRAGLEAWSRANWPLVGATEHVIDCVDDIGSRRYNQIGWNGDASGYDKLKLRYECRMQSCDHTQCIKVKRHCPIPQMSTAPESTCGPYGDQNMYQCVPKVPFSTSAGDLRASFAYCWLGLSGVCFFLCAAMCVQGYCNRKKRARVSPYTEEEEQVMLCDKCEEPLDIDAMDEGSYTCTKCIMKAQMPEVCTNCGATFDDPEDIYCSQCQAPRQQLELGDGGQVCPNCSYQLSVNDAKCPECDWHPQALAIVSADNSLRATADTAANERRIVAVDVDLENNQIVTGSE